MSEMNNMNNTDNVNNNTNNHSYEFKDGFKLYRDERDLDFYAMNNLKSGDNLLVNEDGLYREYNIKLDNNILVLQLVNHFRSHGIKIESSVIGNGENGVRPEKVLMYISVPEFNSELNLNGKQLAKWFAWCIARMRVLFEPVEVSNLLKRQGGTLEEQINSMSGFSEEKIKNFIEIRSKIRKDEEWSQENRANFLIRKAINQDLLYNLQKVYGDKMYDVIKEIQEYGEWMKEKGFRGSAFGIASMIEAFSDGDGENDKGENGKDKNERNIKGRFDDIDGLNELLENNMEDVDMESWSEEDKEKFYNICRRMNEIAKELLGDKEVD